MAETTQRQETKTAYPGYEDNGEGTPGNEGNTVKSGDSKTAVAAHDFHRLMEAFTNEIKLAVPCDGIKFRADNTDQHFVTGVLDHYLCCFEIKVGEISFGNIYFARETQFMDSELTILENMVAGLVLPLCHLFQTKVSINTNPDSDSGDDPGSTPGTVCHQPV